MNTPHLATLREKMKTEGIVAALKYDAAVTLQRATAAAVTGTMVTLHHLGPYDPDNTNHQYFSKREYNSLRACALTGLLFAGGVVASYVFDRASGGEYSREAVEHCKEFSRFN